jgi:hypothetical protein
MQVEEHPYLEEMYDEEGLSHPSMRLPLNVKTSLEEICCDKKGFW